MEALTQCINEAQRTGSDKNEMVHHVNNESTGYIQLISATLRTPGALPTLIRQEIAFACNQKLDGFDWMKGPGGITFRAVASKKPYWWKHAGFISKALEFSLCYKVDTPSSLFAIIVPLQEVLLWMGVEPFWKISEARANLPLQYLVDYPDQNRILAICIRAFQGKWGASEKNFWDIYNADLIDLSSEKQGGVLLYAAVVLGKESIVRELVSRNCCIAQDMSFWEKFGQPGQGVDYDYDLYCVGRYQRLLTASVAGVVEHEEILRFLCSIPSIRNAGWPEAFRTLARNIKTERHERSMDILLANAPVDYLSPEVLYSLADLAMKYPKSRWVRRYERTIQTADRTRLQESANELAMNAWGVSDSRKDCEVYVEIDRVLEIAKRLRNEKIYAYDLTTLCTIASRIGTHQRGSELWTAACMDVDADGWSHMGENLLHCMNDATCSTTLISSIPWSPSAPLRIKNSTAFYDALFKSPHPHQDLWQRITQQGGPTNRTSGFYLCDGANPPVPLRIPTLLAKAASRRECRKVADALREASRLGWGSFTNVIADTINAMEEMAGEQTANFETEINTSVKIAYEDFIRGPGFPHETWVATLTDIMSAAKNRGLTAVATYCETIIRPHEEKRRVEEEAKRAERERLFGTATPAFGAVANAPFGRSFALRRRFGQPQQQPSGFGELGTNQALQTAVISGQPVGSSAAPPIFPVTPTSTADGIATSSSPPTKRSRNRRNSAGPSSEGSSFSMSVPRETIFGSSTPSFTFEFASAINPSSTLETGTEGLTNATTAGSAVLAPFIFTAGSKAPAFTSQQVPGSSAMWGTPQTNDERASASQATSNTGVAAVGNQDRTARLH